jgi:hypothetical protein
MGVTRMCMCVTLKAGILVEPRIYEVCVESSLYQTVLIRIEKETICVLGVCFTNWSWYMSGWPRHSSGG